MNNQQTDNSRRTNKIRGILLEHSECLPHCSNNTAHFNSSVTRYSAIYVHSSLPLTSFTCSSPALPPPTDLRVVRLPGWPGTISERSGRVGGHLQKAGLVRDSPEKLSLWHLLHSIFNTVLFFKDQYFPTSSVSRNAGLLSKQAFNSKKMSSIFYS